MSVIVELEQKIIDIELFKEVLESAGYQVTETDTEIEVPRFALKLDKKTGKVTYDNMYSYFMNKILVGYNKEYVLKKARTQRIPVITQMENKNEIVIVLGGQE